MGGDRPEGRHSLKRAVALGYGKYDVNAPKVLAKGQGITAEKILEIAKESGVAVYEDGALLSMLYVLDIGEEIPESLYLAAAKVLAFVYRCNKSAASRDGIDKTG